MYGLPADRSSSDSCGNCPPFLGIREKMTRMKGVARQEALCTCLVMSYLVGPALPAAGNFSISSRHSGQAICIT
jgi:hypothetical protein